jgi:hypothetical protein
MSWRVCLLWGILAAMLANKTFIYSQTTLGHRFVNKRPVGKLGVPPDPSALFLFPFEFFAENCVRLGVVHHLFIRRACFRRMVRPKCKK